MAYETVQFLTAGPWGPNLSPNGFLLSFVAHQLTASAYDESIDGSHLPMVQPVRELQRRVDDLDQATTKYRKKSAECTGALQGDLAICDDDEVKVLTESLMLSHKMLADYLEGLHPILRAHRESVKRLSEYLTPPTAELFHKKASNILKDAPPQQISMSKKNTCTICMDTSADCVIKRTCCDAPSSSAQQVRCERDMCKCPPTMCKDCLLTHYWTSTGKGSKSYARCVCCRAEFCLKDVFPVQYVEDEAYIKFKAEQENKGKEKEAKLAVADEEQTSRSRRTRKSNLHANTTTTTTTTTTTSSTHSPFSTQVSPTIGRYNTFPNDTFTNTTSTTNSSSSEEGSDDFGSKKRRKVNNNCTNNANSSNHDNHNNENSDSERPKYHLRSSQRRSER